MIFELTGEEEEADSRKREVVEPAKKQNKKNKKKKPALVYEEEEEDIASVVDRKKKKKKQDESSSYLDKKKPRVEEGFVAKRRERRERDAKVRSGELALPAPVIEFDSEKAKTMQKIKRCGVEINLPSGRAPYRSQLQVIDGALKAMAGARSAFLESPTGTGKTLAALASVLAWQRHNGKKIPTRVVWVARTHDQLQHAVHEYRRCCAERPLMSLRLSRERFCLHPDIMTAPDKATACEEATKIPKNTNRAGRFDQRNSGCGHLDKAERIGYPQSRKWRAHFRLGGDMNTWDIEEAVAEGNGMTVCPFHMAQDQIQDGAALVFITYQQLVLEDAVVVVDEAHNLPAVARDAASYELAESRLAELVATLREFLPQIEAAHEEAYEMLASLVASPSAKQQQEDKLDGRRRKKKKLRFAASERGGPLVALLSWLRGATEGRCGPLSEVEPRKADDGGLERVWDGASAALLAREVVGLVDADRVDEHCKIIWKLRKTLIEEGLESGAVRSDTINDLEAILVKLRYVLDSEAATHYRLIATRSSRGDRAVRFVCLSGSVAMRALTRGQRAAGLGKAEYLKPARSLLLLSGTLRPFDLLAHELGMDLVVDESSSTTTKPDDDDDAPAAFEALAVEACHLPSIKSTLLPLQLHTAAGVELDASHNNATRDPESRTAKTYLDAVGTALLGVAKASPHGMLVFFKSYKLLDLSVERWTETGRKDDLRKEKRIFVEERKLTGEEFDARVAEYRSAARSKRGALLLAVMRGRAAEGADFKDEAARVVVVVGIPYPPRFDAATRLKIAHEKENGEKWYAAEAYRNINQAAGRLIRHKKDFGALVLLDKNLRRHSFMSAWYAANLAELDGSTQLHNRLLAFFRDVNAAPQCRPAAMMK
ncbi:hypothetical protein CTAYLR_009553 [Chrysophaeum taylorii]|uniref:Helicase ATP-binding domain-containing protein n=1 Tax=Chrysophaeum taylorii TaxID=2483200 RepID=A0AAD7UI67_9STRA|nr:hypothetical protein CTAYLR_009553 [Chrysophaeum taylorii]